MTVELLDYIPAGAENAIQAGELCKRAGFPSVRAIQPEIHRLRERGHLVCSSTEPPTGYFIAANHHEAARLIRNMESRREIGRAIKAAKWYTSSFTENGR